MEDLGESGVPAQEPSAASDSGLDTLVVRANSEYWEKVAAHQGLRIFECDLVKNDMAFKVNSETITTVDLRTGEVRYPFRAET